MSIYRLTSLTLIITFSLIVFGGYVVSTGSGMGCGPEWPLCNGAVIPELHGETLIEFAHRVIAVVVGILTIGLSIKIFRSDARELRALAVLMPIVLAFQIIIGAIIVFLHVPASIVTLHLLVALVFLACLIGVWRESKPSTRFNFAQEQSFTRAKQLKTMTLHVNALIALLLVTFGFGGYIKHFHGYREAFDWLFSTTLPANTVQFLEATHLILAAGVLGYIALLAYWSQTKGWDATVKRRLMMILYVVIVQAGVGLIMIWLQMPINLALLHLALATLIFAMVTESRFLLSQFSRANAYRFVQTTGSITNHGMDDDIRQRNPVTGD